MRATIMYGAGDVRVEHVPDAQIKESTDALVVVTRAAICGSDLWPFKGMPPSETGRRMGHEFIGIVEAVGKDVHKIKVGDLVAAPFAWSDGTCEFCLAGLHTSCLHGGWWGGTELDGGQGEAVRVPQADGRYNPYVRDGGLRCIVSGKPSATPIGTYVRAWHRFKTLGIMFLTLWGGPS